YLDGSGEGHPALWDRSRGSCRPDVPRFGATLPHPVLPDAILFEGIRGAEEGALRAVGLDRRIAARHETALTDLLKHRSCLVWWNGPKTTARPSFAAGLLVPLEGRGVLVG